MAGSTAFTMTVTGSGFISGTTVLWNGAALPTTFVDAQTLSVTVGAGQVAVSGLLPVTARAGAGQLHVEQRAVRRCRAHTGDHEPGAGGRRAGGPGLHADGDRQQLCGRCPGAVNAPLATQVVSASQPTAQISAALIANGQTAGVAVRNQQPDAHLIGDGLRRHAGKRAVFYLPAIRR